MSTLLTKKDIVSALPPQFKSSVTDQLVDMINNVTQDQTAAEQIRNNFVTYAGVMKDGKFKTQDYLNAVQYVTYKHMGYSNKDAYFKTFPNRQAELVARGTSEKDISAYVSAYHRGKLVNLIMEQSLIPVWIVNQDLFQEALNHQAWLMKNATSEKVQCDAANSILTHLQKPKDAVTNINLDLRENSGLTELKNTLTQLAEAQKAAIEAGTPTKVIAGSTLVREDEDIIDV
ncbi:gp69 [Escherichia phage N4]|uniref:Gp69 n=1 Tax=Enterobacteria phage N4 TaxID=2886925 RepID=A0MZF1_BPN4|nr:gp69 [Escherichia phage N4]ABK54430.1 gp69 [Escherichia phage N4]